ncbi:MAG: hypothetical protein ACRCR1_04425 [Aeromonas sp.]
MMIAAVHILRKGRAYSPAPEKAKQGKPKGDSVFHQLFPKHLTVVDYIVSSLLYVGLINFLFIGWWLNG